MHRAVASKDSRIDVVDIEKREVSFSLHGHQGGVCYVVFDPKGDYLSSISEDGTLRVWNVKKKSCETSKPGISKENALHLSCGWTTSGNYLAIPFGREIQLIKVCLSLWIVFISFLEGIVGINVGFAR